jgi:thiamine biosynthesis protein ThiI
MKKRILIKYGEIALKGQNRNFFLNTLIRNIRYALKGIDEIKLEVIQSRIMLQNVSDEIQDEVIMRLGRVFGIVSLAVAYETDSNMDSIYQTALEAMSDKENITFKVESRRGDKSFEYTSPQISAMVGEYVLNHSPHPLKVDVINPDYLLSIEVRQKTYIYYREIKAQGGLPMNTSGNGLILLSGGIDSPVATFMSARRGMKMSAIHFHSYPYTSLNAQEKVEKLSGVLSPYNQGIDLYLVSLTKIQEEIIRSAHNSYLTILLRRAMFRIAQSLASEKGFDALVTGENLGQVASQTIQSLNVTNRVVELPVLRPLIGFDKNDIVKIAKQIGTFDISIEPYDDCCSIFVPKHPQTRPRLENVELEEAKLQGMENYYAAALNETILMQF